jgi:hypothetical protein
MLLGTSKVVLKSDSLTSIPGTVKVMVTDVNWNLDNHPPLYPFFPTMFKLKRVISQNIIENLNKN